MKEDEWQKVIDVNLTSTFLLSKYSIKKMMKNNSGRVINITSIVGHRQYWTVKLRCLKSRYCWNVKKSIH